MEEKKSRHPQHSINLDVLSWTFRFHWSPNRPLTRASVSRPFGVINNPRTSRGFNGAWWRLIIFLNLYLLQKCGKLIAFTRTRSFSHSSSVWQLKEHISESAVRYSTIFHSHRNYTIAHSSVISRKIEKKRELALSFSRNCVRQIIHRHGFTCACVSDTGMSHMWQVYRNSELKNIWKLER